jgi:recombination protein RecA
MPLTKRKTNLDTSVEQVIETSLKPVERTKPLDYNRVISTGSTLLDLAISGGRRRGGGIPAGIIVEIFGPEATGKTALAAEISSHIQAKGGKTKFADPEARLDKEYCEIYGLHLNEKEDYFRPDMVTELFDAIWEWETNPETINGFIADSIAALSTKMEMEDEDKMGMRRAKEFSEGLRKTCRKISSNDKLIVLTNQIRDTMNTMGDKEQSTGGHAVKFYSSLRLKTTFEFPQKYIKRQTNIAEKTKAEKIIGINTTVKIVKSTVDDPYREAPVRIVFGYGIDDIRANLEYLKKMTGNTKFPAVDKEWQSLEGAIKYIEEKDYSDQLKEQAIDLWEEIEQKLKMERKPKHRG